MPPKIVVIVNVSSERYRIPQQTLMTSLITYPGIDMFDTCCWKKHLVVESRVIGFGKERNVSFRLKMIVQQYFEDLSVTANVPPHIKIISTPQ